MRVLVIQCSASPSTEIQSSLAQRGHSVDLAPSPADGAELAQAREHDVILIDGAAVEGSAADLCRDVRRSRVGTPILVVSPLGSTAEKIAGLDAGADDYLTAPVAPEELNARLRSLLRRSGATQPTVLRAGDLELNVDEHEATLAGVVVKLSAKEFALLEFMMRNPRKLLTRTMISQSVWDMNYESCSNVIDVYVSSLRRKVDRGRPTPRIQTVIGSGYRFMPLPDAATDAAAPAVTE